MPHYRASCRIDRPTPERFVCGFRRPPRLYIFIAGTDLKIVRYSIDTTVQAEAFLGPTNGRERLCQRIIRSNAILRGLQAGADRVQIAFRGSVLEWLDVPKELSVFLPSGGTHVPA